MSDTSDRTSCISHRPLVHYFIVHEDYLEVAKVSEHQYKLAAFWRVLETKTNDRITYNEGAKEKGQPVQDMWIEIPYSEFVNRCLGVYKASSFQIAAAESERLGFSKSRVQKRARNPLDPHSPLEDYKEYLLDVPALQKAINTGEYPTPIEINSPLLKSIIAKKEAKKQKKAIENNSTGVEKNSPPIEKNTSAIEINRKSNITVSNSITKIGDTYVVPAFADHNDTPAFSLEATSQQLPTPEPDLSPERVDKSAQTDNNTSVPPQASEQPPIANATRPAVVEDTPPSEKPARAARQRKPKEEKAKPSLSKEEETLRKEVLTWINTKRGYKLYGRATVKEIQSEYQCAHTLAHMLYVRLYEQNEEEGCTWEDLEYTHEYCSKRDNYWKLPDNKIRIGTFAVLQKFAVAMALKVQQPLINLEDRRNGVLKQTALEHGSRRSFLEEEKAREQSGIWGDLKKGTK